MKDFWRTDQSRGPDDFGASVLRMKQSLRTSDYRRIWLACSGGLDSMVLMHTLNSLRVSEPSWELGVLHVNYRLRAEEADRDAIFVQRAAEDLGLICRVLTIDPSQHPQGGIQEWARDVRYRWFAEQREEGDCLATAHHADDLVETILMRLARGAHLAQLGGMEEWSDSLWRPFLGLSRPTLEAEAERQKIPHREDSSNVKLIYSRNRVRHIILPELEAVYPGVRESLLQLAAEGRDFVSYSELPLEIGASLAGSSLAGLSDTVARQKISAFVSRKCQHHRLSRRVLSLIHKALVLGESLRLDLSEHDQALVQDGNLKVISSARRPSMRWSQYEKGLTDDHPRAWLPPGAEFEKLS